MSFSFSNVCNQSLICQPDQIEVYEGLITKKSTSNLIEVENVQLLTQGNKKIKISTLTKSNLVCEVELEHQTHQ